MPINSLDDYTATQLQATVVINSLSTAVNELVRNSVDSKSTSITVKISLSTLSVEVIDNGIGIEDMNFVGKPSYTSKFKNQYPTYGYRGQALASLANVGHVRIVSIVNGKERTWDSLDQEELKDIEQLKNDERYKELNNDERYTDLNDFNDFNANLNHIKTNRDIFEGSTNYTSVCVTDLFRNIPVRREQLLRRSRQKHLREIKQSIMECLVNALDTDVKVIIDNKLIKHIHPKTYSELLSNLLDVDVQFQSSLATYGGLQLKGIIGTHVYGSSQHQYVFFNGVRMNEDLKSINRLFVDSNFGDKREYPVFLFDIWDIQDIRNEMSPMIPSIEDISIETPIMSPNNSPKKNTPKGISANSSPKKNTPKEMSPNNSPKKNISKGLSSQSRWDQCLRLIKKVILSFLQTQGYECGYRLSQGPEEPTKGYSSLETGESSSEQNILSPVKSTLSSYVRHNEPAQHNLPDERDPLLQQGAIPSNPIHIDPVNPIVHDTRLKIFRNDIDGHVVIGQVDLKFILIRSAGTLIIMDQHACDERIRVEQFYKEYVMSVLDKKVKLRLVEPLVLDMNSQELSLLNMYRDNFGIFGIVFSSSTITHLPLCLIQAVHNDPSLMKQYLLEHVWDLENFVKLAHFNITMENWFSMVMHLPKCILDTLNSKACRSAVKFGDPLTHEEMGLIVNQVKECKLPFVCAHGRPSMVPLVNYA